MPYWADKKFSAGEFIESLFGKDPDYRSDPNNFEYLKAAISTMQNNAFPFISHSLDLIGYADGVLNVRTGSFVTIDNCKFSTYSPDALAYRLYDVQFDGETPDLLSYFDDIFQLDQPLGWNENHRKLLLCYIGRLLITGKVNNAWDFDLNLTGCHAKWRIPKLIRLILNEDVTRIGRSGIDYEHPNARALIIHEDEGFSEDHFALKWIANSFENSTNGDARIPFIIISKDMTPAPLMTKNRLQLSISAQECVSDFSPDWDSELPHIIAKCSRVYHENKHQTFQTLTIWSQRKRFLSLERFKKPESFYQAILEDRYKGKHFATLAGVTDVTTDKMHIEIKNAAQWLGGMRQLHGYHSVNPREELRLYLFDFTKSSISVQSRDKMMKYATTYVGEPISIHILDEDGSERVLFDRRLLDIGCINH